MEAYNRVKYQNIRHKMNPERLTNTFQRMRASLKSVALRITGSDEDADDALQDAFVRLWGGHESMSDDVKLEGYLSRSVRNSSVDVVRSRRVNVDVEDPGLALHEEDPPPDTNDLYEVIADIIDRELTPMLRDVMRLREIERLGFNEISARLGIPAATARVYLSRARATVRKIYRMRYE